MCVSCCYIVIVERLYREERGLAGLCFLLLSCHCREVVQSRGVMQACVSCCCLVIVERLYRVEGSWRFVFLVAILSL